MEERLLLVELALRSTGQNGGDGAADVFGDMSDGQRAKHLAVAFKGMSIVAAAADRARQGSDARLMRLAEAGIVGITVADRSGRILEANDAYLAMVGYSRDDFEAGLVDWDNMTPPELRHLSVAIQEQLDRDGVAQPCEKEYVHKSGRRVPVLVAVARVLDGTQNIAISLDLSVQKRWRSSIVKRKRWKPWAGLPGLLPMTSTTSCP
jgi:PAS domain S-box-containing protein